MTTLLLCLNHECHCTPPYPISFGCSPSIGKSHFRTFLKLLWIFLLKIPFDSLPYRLYWVSLNFHHHLLWWYLWKLLRPIDYPNVNYLNKNCGDFHHSHRSQNTLWLRLSLSSCSPPNVPHWSSYIVWYMKSNRTHKWFAPTILNKRRT